MVVGRTIAIKISKSLKTINPGTGLSVAKTAGIKSSVTKSQIDPETGYLYPRLLV